LQEPEIGSLIIFSTPSGAVIYIDDLDTGLTTPATVNNVSVGTHTYALSLSGYTDSTGTFDITYDKIITVDTLLEPLHTGYLVISSTPSGARIFIDNIYTNLITPATIGDILEGNHIYQLSLSGYIDNIGLFDIVYGKVTTADISLELLHRGNVAITSTPPGARIHIDGLDTDLITPVVITGILLGTHTYRLSLLGYIDKIDFFDIEHDKTTIVDTLLEPIRKGNATMSSTPPGAKIYIDGLDTDSITPSIIYDLYPGLHAYELELGGYHTYRGPVDIIQDQVVDIQVNLIQTTGSLYFSTNPEGAAILIDGINTGYITPATITNIPIGQHVYTLIIGNYNDHTGTINVLENGIMNIESTLIPIEGCVSFESSPSGAELIIEGMGRMSTTPIMVCDLPLGKLEYHFMLAGYEPFNGCTVLVPGHGENISHNLVIKRKEGED
jgi:hypothetical protein